jgi:hypothetical protein
MFSDVDETVRTVLIKEGNLDPTDIDISFEIPNREWSAGISRPTLNCYLFDIRENRDLIQTGLHGAAPNASGAAARRRPPLRLDLTYLITAWTRQVEDEHRLLWHAFSTLFRHQVMPPEHLQGELRDHDLPIYASIAQADTVLKSPGDFWTALENQIKPSLSYVVTLAIERDLILAGPPVATRAMSIARSSAADEAQGSGIARERASVVATAYDIRGEVRDRNGQPLVGVDVRVDGSARAPFTTNHEGMFALRSLPPGPLSLIAARGSQDLARLDTEVPAVSYTIIVDT